MELQKMHLQELAALLMTHVKEFGNCRFSHGSLLGNRERWSREEEKMLVSQTEWNESLVRKVLEEFKRRAG